MSADLQCKQRQLRMHRIKITGRETQAAETLAAAREAAGHSKAACNGRTEIANRMAHLVRRAGLACLQLSEENFGEALGLHDVLVNPNKTTAHFGAEHRSQAELASLQVKVSIVSSVTAPNVA